MAVLSASYDNFDEEVILSQVPVLVEFWGSWCPPCKMMEPVLEKLSVKYGDKMKIVKVNIDQNPKLSDCHKIMGAPTFIFFSGGKEQHRIVGAVSGKTLEDLIEPIV